MLEIWNCRRYYAFIVKRKVQRKFFVFVVLREMVRGRLTGLTFIQRHQVYWFVLSLAIGTALDQIAWRTAAWAVFIWLLFSNARRLFSYFQSGFGN